MKAKIYLNGNAKLNFCKARPLPYAQKNKFEDEIDRMIETGILERVEVSEWAAPIVPVKKPDNALRMCWDYKLGINKESKLDNHPVPRIDVSAGMSGYGIFKIKFKQRLSTDGAGESNYLTRTTQGRVSSDKSHLWGKICNWNF